MDLRSESLKVVVHYADGTIIKGSTQDFHPDRPLFRIVRLNGVDTIPVKTGQLKAVFFVKELDSDYRGMRQKYFSPSDGNRGNGRPVAVLFQDGELMVGYTHSYNPERQGFFMVPVDPDENNQRIFVVKSAAKTLKLGPAAEEFVRTTNRPSETSAT